MSRYLLPAVLAILVAVGAGCGTGDDEEAAPGGGAAVEISATEFALDPATIELDEAGTYTFRLVNDGGTVHALEIEGNASRSRPSRSRRASPPTSRSS